MLVIDHEKFTLPNGLEVVVHEDHSLPMVAVNVWYHVGSKDEEPRRTGFAHLFEHVMFEGSKHHDASFFEPLQKVGANLNGSTTPDRTNYWETLPSNYLELALWLESDRMGFLLDALDQSRFDIQRDVVKNERRQSYENRPYGMVPLLLQPALFPAPHPYSWPTIGSPEDLDSASLDDIKEFFRRFYSPSNASVAIAGDVAKDEALRLVERYFSDLPPGPAINRVGRMDSRLTGEVSLTTTDRVQLPRLHMVWPSRPLFDDDEAPLDLLAAVLADGKTSRLYRTLVYETQIARDVYAGHYSQEISGEFFIQITANPGHGLEEIQSVLDSELDGIRREPPTETELTRAVNRIQAQHVRQLERAGGFGGRADQLNHYNVFAGDPSLINSVMDRYTAVTSDDISRVAASVLGDDHVRISVLPEATLTSSTPSLDRSTMPRAAAPARFKPPVPRRERLSNGLGVLIMEQPSLPMVSLGLTVAAGAVTDPRQMPGLASMTASLLPEGTTSRSSQQVAEEMEFLGSRLQSDTGRQHAFVSAETLSAHWPKALEIIADVLRNPTFPPEEVERIRKQRLTDLNRVSDDPALIASRASRALIFGPDSKYGHPANGRVESVESMTEADLKFHLRARYSPSSATLIAVGRIDVDELMSRAEELFGDWASDGAAPGLDAADGLAPDVAETTLFLADKPGAAQSVIRAGHLTIPRLDPEYHRMDLLNDVFGGQFSARLNMNLREDKGYSYGYTSIIDWQLDGSALLAGGAVQTAVTKEAVVETLKEFAEIRGSRPVTDDEFRAAKDGLLRGFPSLFETQGQIAGQLARLVAFGLPDDYYSGYLDRVDAVSLEDVRRAAGERIDDGRLSVLVVGDMKVVEPGLRELGYPVVRVDYEGRPL